MSPYIPFCNCCLYANVYFVQFMWIYYITVQQKQCGSHPAVQCCTLNIMHIATCPCLVTCVHQSCIFLPFIDVKCSLCCNIPNFLLDLPEGVYCSLGGILTLLCLVFAVEVSYRISSCQALYLLNPYHPCGWGKNSADLVPRPVLFFSYMWTWNECTAPVLYTG